MENKKRLQTWIQDHPTEVIIIGGIAITAIGCLVLKISAQNALLAEKDLIIKNINLDRASLVKRSYQYAKENARLHELIRVKDAFYKKMASEALRHGSSLGGEQMAYFKAFYNKAA